MAAPESSECGRWQVVPACGSWNHNRPAQVFSIEERGRDLFDAAERLDLEGIVAKRKADPYLPETVWYKIKSRTYTQAEARWELLRRPSPLW